MQIFPYFCKLLSLIKHSSLRNYNQFPWAAPVSSEVAAWWEGRQLLTGADGG
jgi:hypothetical protein